MMYKTHAAFGFLAGLLAMNYFNVNRYIFLSMAVFGSLFVDIDDAGSYFGNKIRPVSSMIKFLFKHRGVFHSVFMALLIFTGFWYFGMIGYGYGFFIGYLSHLVADGLTLDGVRIFYPFSKFAVRGFFRTGGIFESIFFALVLVAIGYSMILRF